MGEVPFGAPYGESLVLGGDYIYSVNGEIEPGTRTCRMYGGLLVRQDYTLPSAIVPNVGLARWDSERYA